MMERDDLCYKIKSYLDTVSCEALPDVNSNCQVTFLAQGECNQNFVITTENGKKRYVFRLNYESQLQLSNQIRYEYQALDFLSPSKRTPIPYYIDDSYQYFDQGILIMAFLEGRPLEYHRDMTKAADIFAEIHRLPVDIEHSPFIKEKALLQARVKECQQLLEPVWDSPYLTAKQLHLFDNALESCLVQTGQEIIFEEWGRWSITNTEVNSHNFIIGQEKSYLIDWEKPVISHPCQDLTQFLASTTTLWRQNYSLSEDEKELFLKTYIEKTGFNRSELVEAVAIYSPYLMLRALAWSAMAFDQYESGEKKLKNPEIYHKVQQYLDDDFLEKALKEEVLKHV